MSASTNRPPTAYHVLRISLGVLYFHFGILKFFPDLSPAELLASQTIMRLTGGLLDSSEALYYLAIMEVVLGLALIFNVFMRFAFGLFLVHMAGTFAPIIVLPELAFKIFPFAPTIEGQYILKNIVFVAAGWGLLFPHLFRRMKHESPETTSSARSETQQPEELQEAGVDEQTTPALVLTSLPSQPAD